MHVHNMYMCAGYIKRVIVHPAFLNASFKEAEKELAKMDLGEAIFRPSSKVSHSLVRVRECLWKCTATRDCCLFELLLCEYPLQKLPHESSLTRISVIYETSHLHETNK